MSTTANTTSNEGSPRQVYDDLASALDRQRALVKAARIIRDEGTCDPADIDAAIDYVLDAAEEAGENAKKLAELLGDTICSGKS